MWKRLAAALLLVLASAGVVWMFQDEILDMMGEGGGAASVPAQGERAAASTARKTLYFASAEEDLLAPHPVEVEVGADNVETLRNLLGALLAGPREEGYAPILPKGASLRAAFPGAGGIAYVDFDKTFRDAHPGGAWAELMTAYGVASTIILNFPDLFDRVVLLIEGQEAQTIAGALAISGPLRLREELLTAKGVPRNGGGAPGAAGGEPGEQAAGRAPVPQAAGRPEAGAVGLPARALPPVGAGPSKAPGAPGDAP